MRNIAMPVIIGVRTAIAPTTQGKTPNSQVRLLMSWIPSPEFAGWWYDLSWKGIIGFGAIAAFAGAATVIFTVLQFWAGGIIEKNAEARNRGVELQLAEAKSETAKANARAAEANERAQELKLALESEIAARQPRTIRPEQHKALVAALSQIVGKGELTVTFKLYDEESERFAKQLLQVLAEAGFGAKEISGSLSFGPSGVGQVILVRTPGQFIGPSWIGSVQRILNENLGLNFPAQQMNTSEFGPQYGDIAIAIGAKP